MKFAELKKRVIESLRVMNDGEGDFQPLENCVTVSSLAEELDHQYGFDGPSAWEFMIACAIDDADFLAHK